jgi:hypothetical protein
MQAARTENRSFADLLAQAKAQAAAGHRWDPPGDNAAETIMRMIDLIPTATPAQLSDLSALIESGRPTPAGTAATPNLAADPPPPAAAPAPSPSQPAAAPAPSPSQPAAPPPIATAAAPPPPAHPPPAHPLSAAASGQIALGQAPPSQAPLSQLPLAPVPPAVPAPSPRTSAPAAPSQPHPDSTSRAAVLFAHGLDAEHHGDVSGARRFYATAAQQGDAAAARNLGQLYDPTYLKQNTLGGVDPDPALARYWYERAVKLGDAEAGSLLETLLVR